MLHAFTCLKVYYLVINLNIVANVTCQTPPMGTNTQSAQDKTYYIGEIYTYECQPGYRNNGTVNTTCTISGNWSNPAPDCMRKSCQNYL